MSRRTLCGEDFGDAVVNDHDGNLRHFPQFGGSFGVEDAESLLNEAAHRQTPCERDLTLITELLPVVSRHECFRKEVAVRIVDVYHDDDSLVRSHFQCGQSVFEVANSLSVELERVAALLLFRGASEHGHDENSTRLVCHLNSILIVWGVWVGKQNAVQPVATSIEKIGVQRQVILLFLRQLDFGRCEWFVLLRNLFALDLEGYVYALPERLEVVGQFPLFVISQFAHWFLRVLFCCQKDRLIYYFLRWKSICGSLY